MTTNLRSLQPANEEKPKYRILPHNQEAEQGLLGCLLVDNNSLYKIPEVFRADHFYLPVHRKIYKTIVQTISEGKIASPVTLKNFFDNEGV